MINLGKKSYTESNIRKLLEKEIEFISTSLETQKNKNIKLILYIKQFLRKCIYSEFSF